MSNPAPTINQINAFNATQGTTIDFNIIGGTELVRSNRIYIYDLSDNSLICTHLYVSTESIHELPTNTDSSIVYESGKSSADFINGAQYYAQIQTFTDTVGTQGGSGLSVAKMFWCLVDPTLTITTIPSTISTTSYNISATYNANTSVVSNIIQQYQFSLYSATGSLLQSSGVVVGNGEQQGTSTAYDISYNFTGLSVGSSYYVTVNVTTTQGMSLSAQSNTFTVSIDTPTVGGAIVNNNACDGYISVVSNLSDEYGGSASGEMASFETDSVNNVSSLKVDMEPIQEGSGTPSPTNIRPIRGHSGVNAYISPTQSADDGTKYSQEFDVSLTPTSTDKVPYTFKAVGRDVYGDRESDMLVGGTVAWNQLIPIGTDKSKTQNGVTFTDNRDGSYTIQTTAEGASADTYLTIASETTSRGGHVTLLVGAPSGSSYEGYRLWDAWGGAGNEFGNGSTGKFVAGGQFEIRISVGSGTIITTPVNFTPQLFDITQMFGSAIANYFYDTLRLTSGASKAWFRNFFSKPIYAYNAGELMSVNTSAHNTVGFNQWDISTDNIGKAILTDGSLGNNSVFNTSDYIRVIPNATYYFHNVAPSANALSFAQYDSDKNFVKTTSISGASGTDASGSAVMEGNTHFIRCARFARQNEPCINLSDPTRNGEYEPYVKYTYPLDSSLTLRGVPKLVDGKLAYDGDTYESDGTVTRKYGVVDLGTLNWGYTGSYSRGVFYADLSLAKQDAVNIMPNILTDKYATIARTNAANIANNGNKLITLSYNSSQLLITDDSYSDKTTFKTAMSGVYLVYELATPTTETADPFTNPQVVDNGGIEEYVTTGIVPVGHDTTYLTRDVFGGTIDLVTGVLTVDRAMVDLGSLNWSTPTENGRMSANAGAKAITSSTDLYGVISDTYATLTARDWYNTSAVGVTICGAGYGTDGNIGISDPNLAGKTSTQATSYVSGIYAVYPLATPQTYQLTPHQIQTLVGQNNVWSDAGDVEVTFNLPISNLLVKRQDAFDVSGNWLTLYSQPITQASDMNFTFIDFTNQYGKTYKYALVPLLTQTQSGVEVEVEGGYTVSDEVQSIFDGVFIADSTGSQKCKANVGYGNVDMNQTVGTITPIGAQYPVVITNSKNQYHNGSISGTIVPDDYYFNGNLSRIDMVNKRSELEQFLTNKRAKIVKDWNGNIWLVMIMDNVSCTFNNNYGMGIVNFSTNWIEVGDPTNQQDLQATGLINVGGA